MSNKGESVAAAETGPAIWWGEFRLPIGATAQWEVGPLRVVVQRLPGEWLVAHEPIDLTEEEDLPWQFTLVDRHLDEGKESQVARFVCQRTPETVTVQPALADRSVVTRPFTPFTVPVDEKATIYVSTPLWFSLAAGTPSQHLLEIPIQRPSDTWFGPSTREGETCYASRTYGRLNLERLTIRPYRAITQIHINNKSGELLRIERLNLPVPYLSLFVTADGTLWTEAVTMAQTRESTLATFEIETGPPAIAAGAVIIAPSRQTPHKNMLVRTFSVLKLQGG